ncbi:MAG: EamA family transporter [Lachnospiraceae bacterium]|nr:EamA family transporter [Lachnospiraceae bacterium]
MFFLILAASSSAALTLVLKLFRDPEANRFGILLGNYLTCALIAFLQMPEKSGLFAVSSSTLIMSLIGGFLFVAGLVMIQTSVGRNGATLTAAFSKLGLIVPLLISFLFFQEVPSLLNLAGVGLAAAAILLITFGAKEAGGVPAAGGERASLAILLLTLLANGCAESMAKIFSRLGNQREDTRYFFFLFLTAALLTFLLAAAEKKKSGRRLRGRELAAGILAGIPNYFCSYFLLKALLDLPATLAYPAFSVGSILLVTAAGALFFREKLSRRQLAGLGLILGALILLNL